MAMWLATFSAFGVVGVETMLPVALRLVHEGAMSLIDLLRKMTSAPADLLGIAAGRLSVGAPADLVLFDPAAPWKITEAGLRSLSKNTAFVPPLVLLAPNAPPPTATGGSLSNTLLTPSRMRVPSSALSVSKV
ncbi:MAG: amidohydrolase family protein [Sphingomonadales bacterium]|nr:amidohydrolase family protein [Sphingomonadales bacterium]